LARLDENGFTVGRKLNGGYMRDRYELTHLNWMQVESRLREDVRIVIPMGATEEHGYLSLLSDFLFVDRVTRQACERSNVLRAPVIPFGCSAFAVQFPGTISLRTVTLCHVVTDVVDCLYRQGFRRLVFTTGHGGNEVITGVLSEAQLDRPQSNIYYVNAWTGMQDQVRRIESERGLPRGDHAAWYEAFPMNQVAPIPHLEKPPPSGADYPLFPLNPRTARQHLGDGVVSGAYHPTPDHEMEGLLEACVNHLAGFLENLPKTPAEQ
jgi:creatinine amidohydrolase